MTCSSRLRRSGLVLLLALLVFGCDAALEDSDALVLEVYVQAGLPLPEVNLARALALGSSGSPPPATGALITMEIGGETIRYAEDSPGSYQPERVRVAAQGESFRLSVVTDRDAASAGGFVPPPIRLDSVRVNVPSSPIEAVLLDSLVLRLDSLGLSIPSRTGYIYPIDVTVWWQSPQGSDAYWVETTLDPLERFSSTLVDFFLLPSTVLEETAGSGQRAWTGLYAVPVANESDPLPTHDLLVAAVRGDVAFARFALSRLDPDRREPEGNVQGGVGIATGIAVDSVRVRVE